MYQLLNTLYVTTPGAYLRLDHDTVKVQVEHETLLQTPLLHLGGIVCIGRVNMSPALIQRCAQDGRAIVFHDSRGRFAARVVGPTGGNVLLRRAQHEALSNPEQTAAIGRNIVAGKLQNSRQLLLRGAREARDEPDRMALREAADRLADVLRRLEDRDDPQQIRGLEGEAARAYFQVFGRLIRADRKQFGFSGRVRRPPIGRVNALLSFLYALLLNDCIAAAEAVGLDPQVGFLHTLRPGKPALALDLMEELRSVLADRLALTLINRRQIAAGDFEERPGGAMHLTDDSRRRVISAYQRRKQEELSHPLLGRQLPLGLVPHIQARLLARHLRGDLEAYPPFLTR